MKHLFISIIVCAVGISFSLSAQENYIATDSSLATGIKVLDGGDLLNAKFCRVMQKDQSIQYSPEEIKEYGFKDGRVYISKVITVKDSSKQVFLERLVKDTTSLYYYRDSIMKVFYLEKEQAGLVEIHRNAIENSGLTFHEMLAGLTIDCRYVSDAARLVSYRKKSLSRFVENYNTCKPKAFPFFKYGMYAGIGFSTLVYVAGIGNEYFKTENKYFKNADFDYDPGLVFGFFIDYPIRVSDFSIHPEVYFTKNDYSDNYEMDGQEIDVTINTSAVNIPLLFRYAVHTVKARPYVGVGLIYAYQFKQEFEIYLTPLDGSIDEPENPDLPAPVVTNQFGLSAGAGLEVNLNYRLRFYLDTRYNVLYGVEVSGQESYRKKEFDISAGISF
jgi:hypothetical protein